MRTNKVTPGQHYDAVAIMAVPAEVGNRYFENSVATAIAIY